MDYASVNRGSAQAAAMDIAAADASISTASASGINAIDSLLYGAKWSDNAIFFSFPTAITEYLDYTADEMPSGFIALSPQQQQAARSTLMAWASVCNLTFSETTGGNGTIRFGTTSDVLTSFAFMPSAVGYGGDVWFGNSNVYSPTNPVEGSYNYSTFLHEIGHALGLKHPHEDGVIANTSIDCLEYSVMSYRSYAGAALTGYTAFQGSYPTTLMMNDIGAMQYMYGANYNDHAGNTLYKFDPSQNKYFETIWDGGGNDTYDMSAYTTDLKIDLQPGAWSAFSAGQLANLGDGHYARGSVANALLYNGDVRSLIENAIGGSGNDLLQGNQANNLLEGGAGSDTLNGADGMDTLIGGAGADTLDGGSGDDQLWGGSGDDTLLGGTGSNGFWWGSGDGADVIDASVNNQDAMIFYNVSLTACTAGQNNRDLIFGTADGSRLTLAGWYDMSAGSRMQGWVFGDTAFAWNNGAGAVIHLTDRCYALSNIHKATASDAGGAAITGTDGSDTLIGGAGNDSLIGGEGGDQLWGASGDDTLNGGSGSNGFWWGAGDGHDVLNEAATGGHDAVFLYNISLLDYQAVQTGNDLLFRTTDGSTLRVADWYALNSANRVQNWVFGDASFAWNNGAGTVINLTDSCYDLHPVHLAIVRDSGGAVIIGSAASDVLIGSTGDDNMDGGSGDDQLWGASGNDSLTGGGGTDVFWWDRGDGKDVITASAINGADEVKIYCSHTMGDITSAVVGSDLVLGLQNDSADSLTIKNWAAGGGYQLNRFSIGNQAYQLTADGTTFQAK